MYACSAFTPVVSCSCSVFDLGLLPLAFAVPYVLRYCLMTVAGIVFMGPIVCVLLLCAFS